MYTPEPIDVSAVQLPEGVSALIEELARHNHDVWAAERIAQG